MKVYLLYQVENIVAKDEIDDNVFFCHNLFKRRLVEIRQIVGMVDTVLKCLFK